MESWSKRLQLRLSGPLPDFLKTCDAFTIVAPSILISFILLDFYLCYAITSLPTGTTLPVALDPDTGPYTCYGRPYCDFNVKNLLLDPPDFYVHLPLSGMLTRWLDVVNSYSCITPNMISFIHLPVALISAKLVTSDSLAIRRIGVLFFQLRNFLDSLDGSVARARRYSHPSPSGLTQDVASTRTSSSLPYHNRSAIFPKYSKFFKHSYQPESALPSESPNLGYWIDGICDGLGGIFLYLACYFYLQKHPGRKQLFFYIPLISSRTSPSTHVVNYSPPLPYNNGRHLQSTILRKVIRILHRSGFVAIQFGFQCLFGGIGWNYYIANYKTVLESSSKTPSPINDIKADLLLSPIMWMVVFFWRYVNPHTWLEILLIAIFFDRMSEVLHFMKCLGFVIIFTGAGLTGLHLCYTQSVLN